MPDNVGKCVVGECRGHDWSADIVDYTTIEIYREE
jgi:hypothetical protein